MKWIFICIAFLLTVNMCHKEQRASLTGNWSTISGGFQWHYQISPDKVCKTLPEYFGTTQFCYAYAADDSGLVVKSPHLDRWFVKFVNDDLIKVTRPRPAEGEETQFTLLRDK